MTRKQTRSTSAGRLALACAGLGLAAVLAAAGCGGSGMGDAVRKDISARMASAQGPLSTCYGKALEQHRKLRGRMVVKFEAAAKTGAFQNVQVVHDQLRDPGMASCVVQAVSALALEKPQKTVVSVEYPINFSPSSP